MTNEAEIEAALALLRELTVKHGQEDSLNTIEDALDAVPGSAAADEKVRRAILLSMLLDADAESADLLVDDIEALYGGGTQ